MPNLDDAQWFTRLSSRRMREQDAISRWWAYYEGDQPLVYVAKIIEEQQNRFPPLSINWPAVVVDGIDDRSTMEGFVLGDADERDKELWGEWQRNDMDEYQSENHVASLTTGVSYVMVGPDDGNEGTLTTVESPESVTVEIDPRTRRVVAALKVWKSDPERALEDRAVLYLPGRMVEYENGKPAGETKQQWMQAATKLQTSPEVPVVPFFNKQRQRQGRSEIKPLRPIVDAVNQVATNMMAAVEHHAVPRKWALGVSEKNFKDAEGNPLPAWKIATGAIWANPYDPDNPEADPKVGQFAAADMRNFIEVCSHLARFATGLYGMPPHKLGFNIGDNPASADGVRASEDDWIRRIERRHTTWGAGYERVGRLQLAVLGRDPGRATRLEARWRNPATPTQAARADAAVKTYGQGISDLRQARVDYGYSETQIDKMEEREEQSLDATQRRILRPTDRLSVNGVGAAGD